MIHIPRQIIEDIFKQAREELPDETCGLLAGKGNSVVKKYKLTNRDHSPEHFSFDPKEQFHVLNEARKEGLKIIANFHSHPRSPARPSEEDIRLAYDENILYLIASLAKETPVIKAFRIEKGKYEEIQIDTVS